MIESTITSQSERVFLAPKIKTIDSSENSESTSMETPHKFDLATVAKNLELPAEKVRSAVELLEAGNTIPFITRYRKEATGGLSERQLRDIKQEVTRQTALAERRNFVLKSIENQGKLSDELREQIEKAAQSRQIEDLYHPFKPRKTSLAETARQQGLEPLARDILEGHQPDIDLASRATDFVRVDRGLTSVDDVISGVQHILAERFSEHLQLRAQLREIFWNAATIKTELVPIVEPPAPEITSDNIEKAADAENAPATEKESLETASCDNPAGASDADQETKPDSNTTVATTDLGNAEIGQVAESGENPPAETTEETELTKTTETNSPAENQTADAQEPTTASETLPPDTTAEPKKPKKKKKKKKKKSKPDPFAEFANFNESLQKIPPHRALAINRGERAGRLKVKVLCDSEKLTALGRSNLVTDGHPFSDFLTMVSDDAMNRLIIPSIEREVRRDLTERSESHAVDVFARNLRQLFLQPPVRGHRIMGIDPGFRSGCKVAVIDETGQPIGHGVFSIVGNAERIKNNKERLVNLIREHQPQLIAIGNGRGCRSVEQFVSDAISGELADQNIQYTIVNQAGTSAYSTSDLGQQELPDHGPLIRSAVSIARRLQDPLSELVKVDPAHVGVGLYQHDIKAKHLAESLESVVESCVNYVGVNANTASPSLLRYVSGLGQTTARKMVDHRNEKGPFVNRECLRDVPGFGEITFVQSAGFLRIDTSNEPLDQTSIHPEDYELARKILEKIDCTVEELIPVQKPSRFKRDGKTVKPAETALESTTSIPSQEQNPPDSGLVEPKTPTESATDSEATSGEANETGEGPTADATVTDSSKTEPSENPASESKESLPPKETPVENAVSTEVVLSPSLSPEELATKRNRRRELVQKIKDLDIVSLSRELGISDLKLRELLKSLRNPVLDPRDDSPAPVFRRGILKFEDLKKGLQLRGQIVNVVDFGVFLNIGIGESCLVHISRLANRFVRDPHWYYSIGDVLNVWVQDVDAEKRRITLTAIRPDSAKRERRKPRSNQAASGKGRGRRDSGRPANAGGGNKRPYASRGKTHHKKPRKPKPVTPITDEMVDGKEPMRSFSDLLQFHKRKTDDDNQK